MTMWQMIALFEQQKSTDVICFTCCVLTDFNSFDSEFAAGLRLVAHHVLPQGMMQHVTAWLYARYSKRYQPRGENNIVREKKAHHCLQGLTNHPFVVDLGSLTIKLHIN